MTLLPAISLNRTDALQWILWIKQRDPSVICTSSMSSLSVIYIHRQHRHQHHYGQYPIERDRGIVDETEDGQKRRRRLNHVKDNITTGDSPVIIIVIVVIIVISSYQRHVM